MFGNRTAAVVASISTAVAATQATALQDQTAPSQPGQRDAWVEALKAAATNRDQGAGAQQSQPSATPAQDPFRQGFDQFVTPGTRPAAQPAVQPTTPAGQPAAAAQPGRDLSQLTPAELAQYARSLQADVERIRGEGIVAERLRQVYDSVRDARTPDAARSVLQSTHQRYLERQATLEQIPVEGAVTLDPAVDARITQLASNANQLATHIDQRRTDFNNRLGNTERNLAQQLDRLNDERSARLKDTKNITALAAAATSAGLTYNAGAHTYTVDTSQGPTFTDPAASPTVQSALAFRDPAAIRAALQAGTRVEFNADMSPEHLRRAISRLEGDRTTYTQSLEFNRVALEQARGAAAGDPSTSALVSQLVPAIERVTRTEIELEAQNRLPIGAGQQSHGSAQNARLNEVQRIISDGRAAVDTGHSANLQRLDTLQRRAQELMNSERSNMGGRVVESGPSGLPTRIRLGEIVRDGVEGVVRGRDRSPGEPTTTVRGRGEAEQDVADLINAIRRQVNPTQAPPQR